MSTTRTGATYQGLNLHIPLPSHAIDTPKKRRVIEEYVKELAAASLRVNLALADLAAIEDES